jgi:hypothetical protein
VSTVDTASRAVIGTVSVGVHPVGIAMATIGPDPTSLTAGTATLTVSSTSLRLSGLSATLIDTRTNRPVAGQRVVFSSVFGRPLCAATTSVTGVASCDASVPPLVGLVALLRGYTAGYPGSVLYQPATAHGYVRLSLLLQR